MPRQTIACCLLLLCLQMFTPSAIASDWLELAPGIEYQDLSTNTLIRWSHIHAFRIDLKNNKLELIMAHDLSHLHASVDEFAHHSHALVAINGGFFDQNHHPLGLRISNQQQHNPLKNISWWGVFYIQNKKPHLTSLLQFKNDQHIDFAVQTGPRLLINGKIPLLKTGYAERSALGITSKGQLIILVTQNMPTTTTALAELLKSSPLNCTDALNLDGGSSSQLYAHMGAFSINHPGFANVSDAIVVIPR